jgi:hypothetical protein
MRVATNTRKQRGSYVVDTIYVHGAIVILFRRQPVDVRSSWGYDLDKLISDVSTVYRYTSLKRRSFGADCKLIDEL